MWVHKYVWDGLAKCVCEWETDTPISTGTLGRHVGPAPTLLPTKRGNSLPLHHPGWKQWAKSSDGRGTAPGSLHLPALGNKRPVWEWWAGLTSLTAECSLPVALRGRCHWCWAVPAFTEAISDGPLGGGQRRVDIWVVEWWVTSSGWVALGATP